MKKCKFLNSFYFFIYINPLHCLIYSLTKVRNQSLNFCFLWYFLARANDNFLLTFSRNQSIFHHQKFNNISSWLATKWRNLEWPQNSARKSRATRTTTSKMWYYRVLKQKSMILSSRQTSPLEDRSKWSKEMYQAGVPLTPPNLFIFIHKNSWTSKYFLEFFGA